MLRCLDLSEDDVKVTEKHDTGSPIASLSWCTSYSTLSVGSVKVRVRCNAQNSDKNWISKITVTDFKNISRTILIVIGTFSTCF